VPHIKLHAVVYSFSASGTLCAFAFIFSRPALWAREPLGDPEGPRLGRGCCAHRAAAFVCSGRPMGPCGPMGGPCHQGTCERDCYTPILVWAVTIESHADRNMLNTCAANNVSIFICPPPPSAFPGGALHM